MSALTFPLLSEDDIISYFSEQSGKDAPVSLANLKSPTPDSVMVIFSFFMKEIMGFNLEAALELPFGHEPIHYFELYQERVTFLRFFGCMRDTLLKCRYNSFSITDLTAPRPKRLRRQLSALINFALFNYKVNEDFADHVVQQCLQDEEELSRLTQENAELKHKTQVDLQKIAELSKLKSQVESSSAELSSQVAVQQETSDQLSKQLRAQKADLARLRDEVQTKTVNEAQVLEEVKSLEEQLVECPQQVRDSLRIVEEKLRDVEVRRQEIGSRQRDLSQMLADAQKTCADLEKYGKKANEAVAEHQQLLEEQNRISGIEGEMETSRKEVERLEDLIRLLNNKIKMTEDEMDADSNKKHQFEGAVQQEHTQRNRVLSDLKERVRKEREWLEQTEGEVDKMKREHEMVVEQFNVRVHQLDSEQENIIKRVEQLDEEYDKSVAGIFSKIGISAEEC